MIRIYHNRLKVTALFIFLLFLGWSITYAAADRLEIKFIEPIVTQVADSNGQDSATVATVKIGGNQYYAFRIKNELTKYEEYFQKRFSKSKIINETMTLRKKARKISVKNGGHPDSPTTPVFVYVDTQNLFGGTGPALIPMKIFIAKEGTTDKNLSKNSGQTVNSLIVLSDIISQGKVILSLKKLISENYLEVVIAHENAHGMMADLCGKSYNNAQILKSLSTNGHDTNIISDTFLAFSEGWAEGFEAYMGEKFANELNPTEKKGIKKVVKKVIEASDSDKATAKTNFPDIAHQLKKMRQTPIRTNKYVFNNYKKRNGEVKNGLQILASEGAIASQFFLTLLHSGISNSFEKCCTVMAKYKVFNWGDFVGAFAKQYPGDKDKILRLFLEFTKYSPAWNQARTLYHDYYMAKKQYVQKKISQKEFYSIKKEWENQKEEIFKAIKAGKISPTASTGKPIWLSFDKNWRCDLNSASFNEIAVGIYQKLIAKGKSKEEAKKIAIANASAIVTIREKKGYLTSLSNLKKEVIKPVYSILQAAKKAGDKEISQRRAVVRSKNLFAALPYLKDKFLINSLTQKNANSYINVNKGSKAINLFDLRDRNMPEINNFYAKYQKYIAPTSYLNKVILQLQKSDS
jgi:hypothetical protein